MSDDHELGVKIVERLRSVHTIDLKQFSSIYLGRLTSDPFKVLVVTILSQNSTDKAALKAYEKLEEVIGVDAHRLEGAHLRKIEGAIRSAGLYKRKARAIKALARVVARRFGGDLMGELRRDVKGSRELLMSLPGVGPKTADVVLVTFDLLKTVPVDTHVSRVASRLGLVAKGAGYEGVRSRLDELFPPELRHEAHLLLIAHGRSTCRAVKPRCSVCVLNDLCEYYKVR